MRGSVLFFDVFNPGYLPVVRRVADAGLVPVMNATPLAEEARTAGLPVCAWESSIPAELARHVQAEIDRVSAALTEALDDPAVPAGFASPLGAFMSHTGEAFFDQLLGMVAHQIAALDIFDAVMRQHDLRLVVLGCDNSHVQRVLVESARRRDIPTLQLAHGIYAPVRERVAGELGTVYADQVAVYGERGRDVLSRLGNAPDRIVPTGAPLWDAFYGPEAQITPAEARARLGLDPHRPTVVFCSGYADGSSAFFPATAHRLVATYQTLLATMRCPEWKKLGAQLLVRPHPHEFERAGIRPAEREQLIRRHLLDLEAAGNGDIVAGASRTLHVVSDRRLECLRAADVVIAEGHSTIIPEAMILERPVVTVTVPQQDPPVYTTADGIAIVEDVETLPDVLCSLLADSKRRAAMVMAQNRVLPELNHGHDGHAAERVATLIVRLAAQADAMTSSGTSADRRGTSARAVLSPRVRPSRAARPLDVLFAAHDFLPHSRAGTELYTYDLARALERRSHRVRVLYPRYTATAEAGTLEEGTYQGMSVVTVATSGDAAGATRNGSIEPALGAYLANDRPDVVHVQHLLGLSVSFLEVLRRLDIPVVLTANDFWFLCQQLHLVDASGGSCIGPETVDKCVHCWQNRLSGVPDARMPQLFHQMADRYYAHREAIEIPDLVICPSQFLLEMFERYGFKARHMIHLPQGANLFTPVERAVRNDGRVVLTYLGSIGYRKGLDLLVAAFNEVATDRAELRVYGDIVDEEYFKSAMRAVAPAAPVKYHGSFGPADLPGIVAETDVVVVPSRGENFPFVIRETLHAGVPVIAPRVAGIPEIVHDEVNGLLFTANDSRDLATKLATVIESPGLIAQFRRRIDPMKSIDEDACDIEQQYAEVLARRTAPGAPRFDASIIVVTRDAPRATERCLAQIAAVTEGVDYEVIVVDDGSTDDRRTWHSSRGADVDVIRNDIPRGTAAARNQGAKKARGRHLVFLDPRTVPRKGWLSALVDAAETDSSVGIVGGKLVDADGVIRHTGIAFSREEGTPYNVYPGVPADLPLVNRRRGFQAVSGGCLLVERKAFDAASGFDESYRGRVAEVDLCLRVGETGRRVEFEPASVVDQPEGQIGEAAADEHDARRLHGRWPEWRLGDEDMVLVADGCARRLRQDNGASVSVIEPIVDRGELERWERVAEAQRLILSGDLAGAVPLLARARDWPLDPSVLRWAAGICERAGVPGYGAAFRDRLHDLGGRAAQHP